MSATASFPTNRASFPTNRASFPTDRASFATNRWAFGAWCLFSALNAVLMFLGPGLKTVPFHLIWVFVAVYGLQVWPLRWAVSACVVLAVVTGVPLTSHARTGVLLFEEVAEIPIMSVLFFVIVWHVRRRFAAIEEARRAAERERVATQMQELFVRLASHELRTPITVARGYLEMLREDCTDPRVAEDTAVALDELSKLDRIAGRLLTLAWAHNAKGTDTVDVAALVHRVARRWAPVTDRPVRAEVTPAAVVGDEDRLETALDCLVENAIIHTNNQASIVLRACRQEGWVVLEVEDDGPGMAEERRASADGRDAPTNTQRGLGLTIVRGVVDTHGGELLFGTGRPAGLRVTIRLPAADRALAAVEGWLPGRSDDDRLTVR